jgi:DedD protein
MPRPISEEELQLKKRARRRLVGAVVLVTAVAVVLPMVLDSEPKPVTQNVDIQIPSPDSGEFKPKAGASAAAPVVVPGTPIRGMPAVPAATTSHSAVSGEATARASASAESGGARSSSAESAKDAAKAQESGKDETRAAAKDAPKGTVNDATTKDAAAASGTYVVQVAALADVARVKQLQKQMSAAGVKTYTEAVSTKTGEITRVRAGPYPTREAAESARTQLKKAGLDGKVVAK